MAVKFPGTPAGLPEDFPPKRPRLRRSAPGILMLVAASAFCVICCASLVSVFGIFAPEGTARGPYTDPLPLGQRVRVDRQTRGVVKVDDYCDEDSAYPERRITVEILDGPERGETRFYPRNHLRRE